MNGLAPGFDVLLFQVDQLGFVGRPIGRIVQRLGLLIQFGTTPRQRIEFLLLAYCGLADDVRARRELAQRLRVHAQAGLHAVPAFIPHRVDD